MNHSSMCICQKTVVAYNLCAAAFPNAGDLADKIKPTTIRLITVQTPFVNCSHITGMLSPFIIVCVVNLKLSMLCKRGGSKGEEGVNTAAP